MRDEQTVTEALERAVSVKLGNQEVEDSGTGMRVTEVALLRAAVRWSLSAPRASRSSPTASHPRTATMCTRFG